MRMRTILIPLLAVYALALSVFVGLQTRGLWRLSGTQTGSAADINLPAVPPFGANSAAISGEEIMARVQIENELQYTDLQSFTCSERIDRFKGHVNGGDQRQIDIVTTQVSFENGVENYSAIHQANRARATMFEIPGAWSEGEFGTLIRQTRTLLATQPLTRQTVAEPNGQQSVIYTLNVSGEESPWDLFVAKEKYRVPFRTEVTVSQNTGRILRINRTSTAMPPDFGISEIQWAVNLKSVQLDGKGWLLPDRGEYSILYTKANRREWNVMAFDNYHRYTASSVMHF